MSDADWAEMWLAGDVVEVVLLWLAGSFVGSNYPVSCHVGAGHAIPQLNLGYILFPEARFQPLIHAQASE